MRPSTSPAFAPTGSNLRKETLLLNLTSGEPNNIVCFREGDE